MAIRMAKLSRTPTGLWTSRKVIPADVRTAYGKREEKPTWPASLTQGQARAEYGAWLTSVEERIAALRSSNDDGPAVDLTERQSRALAGEWYQQLEAEYGDDPGDEIGWEVQREQLYPSDESRAAALDNLPFEGPWRITPYLKKEASRLLEHECLQVTERAEERLQQDMADLFISFCDLMMRRTRGDYGKDPVLAMLPKWQPAQPVEPSISSDAPIMSMFDGYVDERKPSAATVKAWRRFLRHLSEFLDSKPAASVTPDDIISWKDYLLREPKKDGQPRSSKTVRETYLAAAKAVFGWAKENRKVADNPVVGVTVRAGKRVKVRERGFTSDETQIILRATLDPVPPRFTRQTALARRWVPWLCAYSGARVNEITQLRKQDIFRRDGVWVMNITPEAGSVKNDEARLVPLHSHLLDQGFVALVESSKDGPLFYDPSRGRGGSDGNPQYKKMGERLASWVRSLGVSDPHVAPNHGWRHRFKTVARSVGMDPEARSVIPGHALDTEGERYGEWPIPQLAVEIERLPRIILNPD